MNKKFIEAALQGDINAMDLLLGRKDENGNIIININTKDQKGNTALMIASENNNIEAVRF